MKVLITLAYLCFIGSSYAQFKVPGIFSGKQSEKQTEKRPGPSIKTDIDKVARDLYQGFNNIIGDTLMHASNTITFSSKVIPTGAKNCLVTRHTYPNTYSWQATMFESEEFTEAVARYRVYYRQLAGSSITFYDKASYKLKGDYDLPDEGRAFASSLLNLEGAEERLKSFKVEIGLNYSFPLWDVTILVYEKVADEDIRPMSNNRVF